MGGVVAGNPIVEDGLRAVGRHIADWRKIWGLTSQEVAERSGISRQTLSKIENGAGSVRIESIIAVLVTLDIEDLLIQALDPLEQEVGRVRADRLAVERVRPRRVKDNW